ncbi:MAG: SGNH/GDSL hydrolase family protein [Treponema sp.]|jgi:lysophospholipase L1-like esterase|nr:SGNH/GDSL hydrolase family protein [Treponema sp.]
MLLGKNSVSGNRRYAVSALIFIGIVTGIVCLSACATGAATGAASKETAGNARLQHTLAKLRRGETVSVVALGGSITTGYQAQPPASAGWAGQLNRWWQEKAKVSGGAAEFHNSGASGTDSAFAAVRVKDHALAYEPDLVIVEFAINDQWLNARVRQRSFEGVLRQLLAGSARSVMVIALNEKADSNKSTFREQERIGKHYGIPVLAWADWVKFSEWDRWFTGSEAIHPNNDGHANIAEGIIRYLDAVWDSLPPDDALPPVNTALPAPLVSAEFQQVALIGGQDAGAMLNFDTSRWQAAPAILPDEWPGRGGRPLTGWTTDNPQADLSVRVRGKSVGLLFAESDQFTNGLAWIEDGKETFPKVIIRNYVNYRRGYYGYAYAEIADNLDPEREYVLRLAVNPGGRQGSVHIAGVVCTLSGGKTP